MNTDENLFLITEYKKTGNTSVRNEIINKNLGLLQRILDRMSLSKHFDEIQSFAVEEMIKAINAFDPSRNVKLSTFLYKYIKTGVHLWIRERERQKKHSFTSFDSLESFDDESCLESLVEDETKDILLASIKTLKPVEIDIITAYYGIGRKKETQVAIAKRLEATIHFVFKTRKDILRKLHGKI